MHRAKGRKNEKYEWKCIYTVLYSWWTFFHFVCKLIVDKGGGGIYIFSFFLFLRNDERNGRIPFGLSLFRSMIRAAGKTQSVVQGFSTS